MTTTTHSTIIVTNEGGHYFNVHQGLFHLARIPRAWLRYATPHLQDGDDIHYRLTDAYTKAYEDVNAAQLPADERARRNSLALESFRRTAGEAHAPPARLWRRNKAALAEPVFSS